MIHRSRLPDLEIPDCTLTEFVFETAARRAGHPAFIDGVTGRTITYREWVSLVRRTAAGLAENGMERGDALAIFMPNLPEYGVAFHGTSLAGGIVTTVNPLSTADELRRQLVDCDARYVLTVPETLAKALEACAGLGVRRVFVAGDVAPDADGAIGLRALTESTAPEPQVRVTPDDVFVLPYSSGTTGLPKGVMLTHRNLIANTLQTIAGLPHHDENVRHVAFLPYFHIYGMVVVMHVALRLGATQVTLPRFEPTLFLETLEKYRITFAALVPPVILLLARHPDLERYDLSALEEIMSGAAPLSREAAAECCRRLGVRMVQGYGLTETSPVTHLATPEVYASAHGTIGHPVPGTEVKVIADDGRALPPNERGQICVRGPQVMKGYLNRPDATAAMIDAEGWLHTGDIGYADAEGRFFIVDRAKELIKYKGCQVPPAELEALLLTHPAIADAAVVGVPDEVAGELPKAFVVLKGPAEPGEIQAWVAERVAPFKKLRLLEIVDAIPKSASGKILRRVLRDRHTSL